MPGSTQEPDRRWIIFAYETVTLFGWLSHTIPLTIHFVTPLAWPYNPDPASWIGLGYSHFARHYFGNDFFSSGYLDVSVPQVPRANLYIQKALLLVRNSGFPHSDIPGYNACSRLPEAYRSDPRPSSALGAKASTISS